MSTTNTTDNASASLVPEGLSVVLGSSSQWRRSVIQEMGLDVTLMSPDIDEKAIRDPDVKKLPLLIAHAKADALVPKAPDSLLITADQVTLYKDTIREKPETEEEAWEYLRSYREAPVSTYSALVVTNTATEKRVEGIDVATVEFSKDMPDSVIESLIKKGDVMSCAGGFTVEDPILAPYVTIVRSSIDSVQGLPKQLLLDLLTQIRS
eukprot:GFYU01023228.1.p1 GENE.GFYU01023228.1~~GFYU01023228.1.p1  ORF type:complete len:220 (-),score=53.51 GFYU01023228.1:367-990(-)